eukprot:1193419-Prorocentrum_minimum.AAC.4
MFPSPSPFLPLHGAQIIGHGPGLGVNITSTATPSTVEPSAAVPSAMGGGVNRSRIPFHRLGHFLSHIQIFDHTSNHADF